MEFVNKKKEMRGQPKTKRTSSREREKQIETEGEGRSRLHSRPTFGSQRVENQAHSFMELANKKKERSPPKFLPCQKNMACQICLTREHWSAACPYYLKYPAGAIVGRFARIICICCGDENAHPGEPGVDWDAKVHLKASFAYPSIEEQLMELNNTRTSVDATGNKARPSEAAADGTCKASRRKT